jgi:hypothetical protein
LEASELERLRRERETYLSGGEIDSMKKKAESENRIVSEAFNLVSPKGGDRLRPHSLSGGASPLSSSVFDFNPTPGEFLALVKDKDLSVGT